MFWLLQVSKIQDGGQNGCRFPILIIIISQPFVLKHTSKVSKHMFWGMNYIYVNIITTFQLLQVPKIQNGRFLVAKMASEMAAIFVFWS